MTLCEIAHNSLLRKEKPLFGFPKGQYHDVF